MGGPLTNQGPFTFMVRIGAKRAKDPANHISVNLASRTLGKWASVCGYTVHYEQTVREGDEASVCGYAGTL